jgi:Flp pilus assembly protein TadG
VMGLSFAAIVIDMGRFMHGRQEVQNAVDAAALAAAQELPDNGSAAQTKANQYLSVNDPHSNLSGQNVTFRCIVGDRDHNGHYDTTDVPAVCNPGSNPFTCSSSTWTCSAQCDPSQGNKCKTVVVGASEDVPFLIAPIFDMFHKSTGNIRAAACRGACGGPPTMPLDVVIIIDRTRSMSTTDLNNAKNAAKAALTYFDPSRQHVALAVLPQSQSSNRCKSVLNGDMDHPDVGNWVPVGLSSDYQNPDKTLNTSSLLVSTINCLELAPNSSDDPICLHYNFWHQCDQWDYPGYRQTNIGEPVKRADQLLQTTGRPDVKKGIILLTDGAANRPSSTSPCIYARDQAATAKTNADEIFTIGFGIEDAKCEYESSGTTYYNKYASALLGNMATESVDDHYHCETTAKQTAENGDGDHFMCEAKSSDLAPLFQQAAAVLASGSRLIQLPD